MSGSPEAIADDLRASTPTELDLTVVDHADQVHAAADRLNECSAETLDDVERRLFADEARRSVGAHVALKLARSKTLVRAMPGPRWVSLVFAVYKEHRRILPASESDVGEDFLRRKLRQLDWLFGDHPTIDWDLSIVDDGCPDGSGALAEEILAGEPLGSKASVLYLQDAIDGGHPVASGLKTPADSRKGGSILYGMAEAAAHDREGHVVAFTDADLSTNLAQLGLLVGALDDPAADAAIGSRREATSVAIKRGQRNVRGKLFIFLWKRLLAPLGRITDTQCGFKAFRADLVRDLVEDVHEKQFAFDIELLLKTELRRSNSIVRVPIAWIDSEAASTTTDQSPYLPMLRAVAGMYRRELPATPEADAYADLIESLDEDAWQRLLGSVPPAIADGDPQTFGDLAGVDIEELRQGLG